ncbi:TM2 domain-containing protein 2 isoform X1 [Corvus cornix cornix]|uniref:TM2 domain-containing protein 2 isoform X1 n=1 Tax=Corvus cornix cornix TaxID=932674 RepID=UPI001951C0A4|nr:TM2 domain-containing protein 2 isoform X1 [Corvus cornix cornix]
MAPPVGYALLCGQAVLLLGNLLLLHGRGLPGNDTEPRDLPPGPPAAAWAYSDPRAPLVLCTYLPDEFVECEEPVDHGGNATAQQELGHGCVKVRAGRGGGPTAGDPGPRRALSAAPAAVRRTGPRRGGSHPGAVPSAGRHRVREPRELPAGQPALCQVHGTLLHHHSALLLLPGLLRSGSVLPGPHRHRRGEAADPGGPGHLVVCGSDSADHRWADAQRWQQLVHRVLREGQGWPQLQPVDASARSKQQPRLCLAQRGLTELLTQRAEQSLLIMTLYQPWTQSCSGYILLV